MRSMVDSDDSPDLPKSDPEVTLGMASLLGIFFGLVVLCGAFFGFGYSVGKRYIPASSSHPPKAAPTDGATPADLQPQSLPTPPPAKPSADSQELGPPATLSGANSHLPSVPVAVPPKKPQTAPTPSAAPPQSVAATDQAASPHPSERSPSTSPFPDYMVQIAAISRPADGDALIAALRKRGYNVSAYTEPQDKLLHVQIGPFATRAEANAMRQKLLGDGYNAIIK